MQHVHNFRGYDFHLSLNIAIGVPSGFSPIVYLIGNTYTTVGDLKFGASNPGKKKGGVKTLSPTLLYNYQVNVLTKLFTGSYDKQKHKKHLAALSKLSKWFSKAPRSSTSPQNIEMRKRFIEDVNKDGNGAGPEVRSKNDGVAPADNGNKADRRHNSLETCDARVITVQPVSVESVEIQPVSAECRW